MRKSFAQPSLEIADYVESVFQPEDSVLTKVRESSQAEDLPPIQVCSMDALHLEILTRLCGAKKIIECGTLGGYSGIALLRGGGKGATLHTLEKDPKHAAVARKNFATAGYSEQVKIWEGPALESLQKLSVEGPFDLIFIDADKANYTNYFDWAAKHLKVGGVVIGDNCFAFGTIAQKEFDHPNSAKVAAQLDEFNVAVARHPNFRSTMLPTGEGMLVGIRVS